MNRPGFKITRRLLGANRLIPIAMLLLLVWPLLASAAVTTTLDRQQLYEGDVLNLTIESSGQRQGAEPDLTPLEQDFDILGTSRGSQISIINGRASSSQQWRISLKPKRLGELNIPVLAIGDESTQPMQVQVSELPASALGSPGDDVFVELELERPAGTAADEPVMVQQQLPLVVRLYSALPLRGGTLTEPRAEGAVLERLGGDQRYSANRNGREYQVIERRYSLSPERSGELRIPPVVFEGELTPGASGGTGGARQRSRLDRMFEDFPFANDFATSPLAMLEPGQPVRAQSRALALEVTARPEAFAGGNWLPAEALSVADSWAASPPSLRVGEPVTRTLTLTAKGLVGSQIADVDMQVPDDVRAYREPTENETQTDGQGVYAVSRQSMTLIPTRAGTLELPELRVRWWDITAQRERETLVPALSLAVAAAAGQQAPDGEALEAQPDIEALEAQPDSPAREDQGLETMDQAATPSEKTENETDQRVSLLVAALLALLALVAAGVLAMMAMRKRGLTGAAASSGQTSASGPAKAKPAPPRLGALREAVRQAAEQHQPQATAEALLALGRTTWPDDPPLNLSMLARRLTERTEARETDTSAAAAITELERALYAPPGAGWSGDGFWDLVRPALGSADAPVKDAQGELPPLYPDR
ncbi:BatD family protein [Thiorhodovibrio frisius]|uniref:BatD family protein n=1 Tax=Thiorhodovibrio frisius TaxID=631362 RepID=UPI00167FDE80|nr:BatD family protein [Thiorhodovibrio frisius]